jgi:hypothetical protein
MSNSSSKGRLTKLEKALVTLPWQAVREGGEVAAARWRALRVGAEPCPHRQGARDPKTQTQMAVEAPQGHRRDGDRPRRTADEAGRRAQQGQGGLPTPRHIDPKKAAFTFALDRDKLRQARRREGRYLLRSNLTGREPAEPWRFYIQLVEVEAAFKNLKSDLQLRPIYHQLEHRIEAHIFVAFLAYCLHVTLRARLKPLAPGLTARAVLDKFAGIQMLDVHFPTTDGRTLIMSRYTALTADQKLLVRQLKLDLPPQPAPRITAPTVRAPANRP